MTEHSDTRGLTLSGGAVPGETFSTTFRIFDRDTGQCVNVVIGRQKAWKWAKTATLGTNKVYLIRNGALPAGTVINGEKYG
jgi:hypothetical protein